MAKDKKDKLKLSKEQKAELKLEKKNLKENAKLERKKIYEELNAAGDSDQDSTNLAKKAKMKKIKKEKEKVDWRTGFREFPVKMVKEINKIRWTSGNTLGKKFIYTLIFVFVFAIFFFVVDLGLQKLFELIYII
ncbi:preprotein translocase subunit SecE [Spiroplasma endosymbiont of Panorpa germanica]|uniref:preprotein translocase subunit SecE n=1 Tax=Spiroplasma endosymbiont of Panorpa germanica TaxID=3066314 RepID=UPI0030D3F0F3